MFYNYLKVALRNLWKTKGFSAINIFGLAMGLATSLLIVLYVVDELSFDRYNEKADRIYRVNADIKFGGGDLHLAVASDPMGYTLKKDYPEVEEYTRIYTSNGSKLIRKGSQFIEETNVAHVDSTFFDVFTLPALEGNTHAALKEPNSVVITESAAKKYFGTTHVLGKVIEADKTPYKITAIIKNIPANSHFHFDFLFSMANVNYGWNNFLSNNFQTYIVLRKGTNYKRFERNLRTIVIKYVVPQARSFMQINSIEEFEKTGNRLDYSLMPLTDIHLRSDRFPELSVNGNIQYVYIFSAVAFFVLLIACINFMNLSTARSANRAKEVGIRKVLGTERKTLITQFLAESTVTVMIALLIALIVAYLVLPYFNDLAAKNLSLSDLVKPGILPFLILLPFLVGIMAGSYPALYLSGFNPIYVLKGRTGSGFKRSSLRSFLVVFQFATSIILIVGTLIVYKQLHFIQSKNLGFNKEQVLIINGTNMLGNSAEVFKKEVLNFEGVTGATMSGFLPVSSSQRNDNSFSREAVMDAKNGVNMQRWVIDADYIPTMGMEMAQGRNFSSFFGSDSNATIINETAAKLLGYEEPVGKRLYGSDDNNKPIFYNIIGVVKNFHFESLHQLIGPLCMMLGRNTMLTSFRIKTSNTKDLVNKIGKMWKRMVPGMPFSYRFLDDSFNDMYRSEQQVGKVAVTFALLTILIASLGLLGLVSYAAEQRIKEIGIRKVLGATIRDIVTMLSKDFIRLVAIASCIALPLSWWGMNKWLQEFAYRISIGWETFLVAVSGAFFIAIFTMSFQTIKAALANPVKNLRTE
ncbi:MAG: ABC transporter permease [Flavisolibacter sp.]